MKKFWPNHKHYIKYSLHGVITGSLVFTFNFWVDFIFYGFINDFVGDSNYTFSKLTWFLTRDWSLLLYPLVMTFIYTFIPCIIGGYILNHYSIKDIKKGRITNKYSLRRGTLLGFLSGLLISIPFMLMMYEGMNIFSLFVFSLGGSAISIGAFIAGGAGYFIHAENMRKMGG